MSPIRNVINYLLIGKKITLSLISALWLFVNRGKIHIDVSYPQCDYFSIGGKFTLMSPIRNVIISQLGENLHWCLLSAMWLFLNWGKIYIDVSYPQCDYVVNWGKISIDVSYLQCDYLSIRGKFKLMSPICMVII